MISRASVGEYRDSDRRSARWPRSWEWTTCSRGAFRWDTTGDGEGDGLIPSLIRASDERRLWSERYETASSRTCRDAGRDC